ncbi:hypothetical protein HDU79_006747 [Rhizoclosmatium sp. JEL0117]|nr:hypothetical protein HDU79_006747 [Rhizoclosmatium sp. JEL0117]
MSSWDAWIAQVGNLDDMQAATNGTDDGSSDYDLNADHLTVIHGALMAVAWGFLAPAGIAVARYLKDSTHASAETSKQSFATWTWFRLHYILFTLAFLLNVVALVLIYMVTGSDHFDVAANGAHVGIGLFVWIAVFVQMALGVLINHLYKPDRESTPWWDHFHHWLGRILFVVSIVNIPLGINLYISGLPDDMSVNPALQTIYIVWVVLVGLAFIFMEFKRGSAKVASQRKEAVQVTKK